MKIWIIFVLAIAFIAGCNPTPGPKSTASPTTISISSPSASAYPASTTSGYPSQNATFDAYPAGTQPAPSQTISSGNFITNTPDPAQDPVVIAGFVHKDGMETVIIKNISANEVNIGSWVIHSVEFSDQDKFLPIDLHLTPGQTYELYNGVTTNQPAIQVWLKELALQQRGDEIDLLNPAGRVIYSFTYYP